MAMSKPAPKVIDVAPDVPANVAALVDKALEFKKDDRWPDAATMQKAVRNAMIRLDVVGISGDLPHEPSAVVVPTNANDPTAVPSTIPSPAPSIEIEITDDMLDNPSIEVRVTETSRVLMEDVLSRCDITFEERAQALIAPQGDSHT